MFGLVEPGKGAVHGKGRAETYRPCEERTLLSAINLRRSRQLVARKKDPRIQRSQRLKRLDVGAQLLSGRGAEAAGVGRLALFHHSPDATDAAIDSLVERARAASKVSLFAAAEGAYLDV